MDLTRRVTVVALGLLGLLAPAACSDDTATETGGAAATGTGTAAASEADFCDVAVEVRESTASTGDQTTEQAATAWTDAGATMSSTQAPEEIAGAWESATTTVVEVGEVLTVGTDAEKAAETQRLVLAEEYQEARAAVDDYVAGSCGG